MLGQRTNADWVKKIRVNNIYIQFRPKYYVFIHVECKYYTKGKLDKEMTKMGI